jgi:hypothetical protein
MKSLYRYQREHYRKITVRRELYDLLRKLADERGKTIPDLIKDLIGTYIGGNIGGNTGSSPSIGGNIGTYIGTNIGSSTPPPSPTGSSTAATTTATSKVEDVAETHIWCRKKSEVRSFKGFLEWVEHNYELLDWWEEGDKYCFETKRSPKDKGRRRGGG